jgi:hypothetical protein
MTSTRRLNVGLNMRMPFLQGQHFVLFFLCCIAKHAWIWDVLLHVIGQNILKNKKCYQAEHNCSGMAVAESSR